MVIYGVIEMENNEDSEHVCQLKKLPWLYQLVFDIEV